MSQLLKRPSVFIVQTLSTPPLLTLDQKAVRTERSTFTFSHLADAFIQSDLQLGVHKAST